MKGFFKDSLFLIVGSIIFCLGFCIFAVPSSLLTGGASGLAMIINTLTGFPIGTGILIINTPLFIAALKICGRGYAVRTLYSTAVFSTCIDIFELFISVSYTGSKILAAIGGGVLTGIGMYILLSRALVTGGSDLLAYLINKKDPKKTIGALIFIIDGAIVIAGAITYNNIQTAIYSVLLIGTMSLVLTTLLENKINVKLFKRDNRS